MGLGIQGRFGKCDDCGEMLKLTGFLCHDCYRSRYCRFKYRTDPEYRERERIRIKAWYDKKKEKRN